MAYPCRQIAIDAPSLAYYEEYDNKVKHAFTDIGIADALTFQNYQSQKWHEDLMIKRFVFSKVYGAFVEPVQSDNFLDIGDVSLGKNTVILDVGGGVTAVTKYLNDNYTYTLMDVLPCPSYVENRGEWSEDIVESQDKYDIIIANDLFPNVDQRLDLFLKRYLPICSVMLLSLTTSDHWYKTKRLDADETLFQQSWDDPFLFSTLRKYGFTLDAMHGKSIFPNGRKVYAVSIPGGLSA